MKATPLDEDGPLGTRRPVIRYNRGELELVELAWGLPPSPPNNHPFRFVRSEDRNFDSNRCLIPASEFHVKSNGKRYRFALEDGNWFYIAGIWRRATADWPESYAILTIEANEDVAAYQDRQGAVLLRRQRMDWLDHVVPEDEILQPLPARSFSVEQLLKSGAAQATLPL